MAKIIRATKVNFRVLLTILRVNNQAAPVTKDMLISAIFIHELLSNNAEQNSPAITIKPNTTFWKIALALLGFIWLDVAWWGEMGSLGSQPLIRFCRLLLAFIGWSALGLVY